jgi:hypothetical protein
MKQAYKNKRDFYKAQSEENLRRAEEAERKLQLFQEKQKQGEQKPTPKQDEYYPVTVYCTNCKNVSNYRVKKGIPVTEAGCIVCNMKGENILYPVARYPGQFFV